MKTTRKLLVLCLAALVGVFCIMPSTFSWYTRDESETGNRMFYSRSGLPVSPMSTGNLSVTTKTSGGASISTNANTTIATDTTQYFTTTITNSGSRDVYVDLGLRNLTNSNKVFVGTTSPTITQKSYASRPVLTAAESSFTRIYFESRTEDHNANTEYWQNSVTKIVYVDKSGATQEASLKSIASDFNVSPEIKEEGKYSVYYYDLPAGAQSFYFKNSTYYDNDHDRNRTQTINEFEPGLVYYLNGKSNNYGNKEISTHDDLSDSLVSVARSYSAVTMSTGRIANLSLSDGTDYTGKTIAYSCSGNASTTSDGKVTATGSGSATFTTRITGYFGDTKSLNTAITIPSSLGQVPVAKNIKVPKGGGKKEIMWYIYNSDTTNTAEFRNVFYTV